MGGRDSRIGRRSGRLCYRRFYYRTSIRFKAKEILKSGELGDVLSFRTTFMHGGPEMWSADKNGSTWFFKKDVATHGVAGDLGIHKIDLIRWLIEDDISEVMAEAATLDKKDETGKKIEVEDNFICILKSSRGILGTITASWTNYGEEDNSTALYCTNGVIKICSNKGKHFPLNIIRFQEGGVSVLYDLRCVTANTPRDHT